MPKKWISARDATISDAVTVSFVVDRETRDQLVALAARQRMTQSQLLRIALESLLAAYKEEDDDVEGV